MKNRLWLPAVMLVLAQACSSGPPPPAVFDPGTDTCAHCRMAVSNIAFAAQIVAPGQTPLFFDDIGCMVEYLSRNLRLAPGAIAYVADHQTGAWVPAVSALYTRNLRVETPMRSHLIAHASIDTQQADPAARTGARVTPRELIPIDLPDGTR